MKLRDDALLFENANIILIKAGTEVVADADGFPSLSRLGSIVEQIGRLLMKKKKVILVTSGAVGIGRLLLKRQAMLSRSIQSHILQGRSDSHNLSPKACAAAGQSGMQSLYETLFAQYDVSCSQILLSDADFNNSSARAQLRQTMHTLLDTGSVPIINENDVISQRKLPLVDDEGRIAWDNDSLAAKVACEMGVDLYLTITDMPGFQKLSSDGHLETIYDYQNSEEISPCDKSRVGTIGQQEKLNSCLLAAKSGYVKAVVMANTQDLWCILRILEGYEIGTLFSLSKTVEPLRIRPLQESLKSQSKL